MAKPSFIVFSGDLTDSERVKVEEQLQTAYADDRIDCGCRQVRALISGEGRPFRRELRFEFRCECGKLTENRSISGHLQVS